MRRDLTQPILDLNDKEIPNPQREGVSYQLLDVALSALLAAHEDERSLTGKEKADRFALALRINQRPDAVSLTAEQLTLLKTLIGKGFTPLVVGRAYELLEQEPHVVVAASADG